MMASKDCAISVYAAPSPDSVDKTPTQDKRQSLVDECLKWVGRKGVDKRTTAVRRSDTLGKSLKILHTHYAVPAERVAGVSLELLMRIQMEGSLPTPLYLWDVALFENSSSAEDFWPGISILGATVATVTELDMRLQYSGQ